MKKTIDFNKGQRSQNGGHPPLQPGGKGHDYSNTY